MFRVIYRILRCWRVVPSGRIATDKAQNSHLCYIPVPWKQNGVNIRSLLWSFPVVHGPTLLIARFYFSNVSNTILNISQYTACGCSTSSLTSRKDLLLRRKLELAVPRKCCTVSSYQHLIEITMNLQIFLDLIM